MDRPSMTSNPLKSRHWPCDGQIGNHFLAAVRIAADASARDEKDGVLTEGRRGRLGIR